MMYLFVKTSNIEILRFYDIKKKIVEPVNDLLLTSLPLKLTNNSTEDFNNNDENNNNNINNPPTLKLDSSNEQPVNNNNNSKSISPRKQNNNNSSSDSSGIFSWCNKFKFIKVQISDSILSISRKYNMTEESLLILNRLDRGCQLYPGQMLIVAYNEDFTLSNSQYQEDYKEVMNYNLLLPRLRERHNFVMYNKDINTLDGYNDIEHYELEKEKEEIRRLNRYQLDNVIFLTENGVELNGFITIRKQTLTFVPSSLNFSFNRFEFQCSDISEWNLKEDDCVEEGVQIDSIRMILRIWIRYYIDNSYVKSFQIHLEKTASEEENQQTIQDLEAKLTLFLNRVMLTDVDESTIYKPDPPPPTTSSIWDKYLSQPIPYYYTSSNPLNKSSQVLQKPPSSTNSISPLSTSLKTPESTSPQSPTTPILQSTTQSPPFSPLVSTKNEEIFKYQVSYIYDDSNRVNGGLVLLPSRVIFQGDHDDPIIKRDGSLKYQLHFTIDRILSCQLIPKINTFSKSPDDLQFNMDSEDGSDLQQPISSPQQQCIHLIIVEEFANNQVLEKDIIFECGESEINSIYKQIKEWMGTVTTPVSPYVNRVQQAQQSQQQVSIASTPTKSMAQSLIALSSSMVDKIFDIKSSYGVNNSSGGADQVQTEPEPNLLSSSSTHFQDQSFYDIEETSFSILQDFTPNIIDGPSTLVPMEDIKKLIQYLPCLYQLNDWVLLYKTEKHGISMNTLYSRTKEKGPCIIVIRDTDNNIFGGFISESLKCSSTKTYYGSGECFLFRLKPHFDVYLWSKENSCFVQTTENYLSMGGGENGKYGLWIDQDFHQGCSSPCHTFDSPCLSTKEDFIVLEIEVWGFNQ
ncbi:hypothetical protein DLAC_08320 [Tieghemostelium lacteum]|uniref:TLDc domain-containing protein n=1 Tax=Tieghemostelium lacteum TaxID=361077 RepID=A0A151ZBP5_TIELA|nr:hypothetical protein DLAC_08320 [Tieghemostelium lacteum]|eukprot:KYQ91366.1 hypothetical protein DLAC_08320 [Tieghemostelium lacteum]